MFNTIVGTADSYKIKVIAGYQSKSVKVLDKVGIF